MSFLTTRLWTWMKAHPLLLVLLLTTVLYLPSLRMGFYADDFAWLLALREAPGDGVAPYFMAFESPIAEHFWRSNGFQLWWSSPEFKWSLLRPLSVSLMQLEWWLWGTQALGYQALSLGLYLGLIGVVWRLFARVLEPPVLVLATLFFALHFSHLQTVWVICNQHSLLSGLLGVLGLLAWLRALEGWGPGYGLWLGAMGLSLAAGEGGVGIFSYGLAHGLVGQRLPWHRRGLRLLPWLGLLLGYLWLHHALGYTSRGSLLYLDPGEGLGPLLVEGGKRLPGLWLGLWGLLPADFWFLWPRWRPALAGLAGLLLLYLLGLLRTLWGTLTPTSQQGLLWFGLGSLGALLPVVASPPGGRLLLNSSLGAAVVLGLVAHQLLRTWPFGTRLWSPLELPEQRRTLLRRLGLPPVVMGLVVWPLLTPLNLWQVGTMLEQQRQRVLAAPLEDAQLAQQQVVMVHSPGPVVALSFLGVRRLLLDSPVPRGFTVLTTAQSRLRLTRLDARTVEVETLDHHLLGEGMSQLFKPRHWPMKVGDVFRQGQVQITVSKVQDGLATKAQFEFGEALEKQQVWLMWKAGRLERLTPPSVGEQVELEEIQPPWGPGL